MSEQKKLLGPEPTEEMLQAMRDAFDPLEPSFKLMYRCLRNAAPAVKAAPVAIVGELCPVSREEAKRKGYAVGAYLYAVPVPCSRCAELQEEIQGAASTGGKMIDRLIEKDATIAQQAAKIKELEDECVGYAQLAAYPPDAQEARADVDRLTRELDVIWNGQAGAAPQASLCDLVCQIAKERTQQAERIKELEDERSKVFDLLKIGASARVFHILQANIENLIRRAACLGRIERQFFMVPGEPDDDCPDQEPEDECLLNWGDSPERYAHVFGGALESKLNEVRAPLAAKIKKLECESEEYAQLQSRCYEGFASCSDGVFDHVKQQAEEIARLTRAAKYCEQIDATPENQRETMLYDALTERDRWEAKARQLLREDDRCAVLLEQEKEIARKDALIERLWHVRSDPEAIYQAIKEHKALQPAIATPARTGIYFASKVKHAEKWKALRAAGVATTSTWIDEAGEGQTADYAELSSRCVADIRRSDALLLYCEAGELLKGALIEVGIALDAGVPVLCVGDCDSLSRVFKRHPLWRECASIEAAIAGQIG